MINDLKEDLNKEMNEIMKLFMTWIRNSASWLRNSAKRLKFWKKKNQPIRNIWNTKLNKSKKSSIESITNRLYASEQRISGIEGKVDELFHSQSNK
jgi:hypothetical protein